MQFIWATVEYVFFNYYSNSFLYNLSYHILLKAQNEI